MTTNTLPYLGAGILLVLASISAFRLAKQKAITTNLLLLVAGTTLAAFVLLGLVPAVIKFSGLEVQLRERQNDLANVRQSAGIATPALKRRLILSGREVLITEGAFQSLSKNADRVANLKYLFSMDRPKPTSALNFSELTVDQYARTLGASTDDVARLTNFSVLREAQVFRVASKRTVRLRLSNHSSKGEQATPDEYRNAWRFYTDNAGATPPDNALIAEMVEAVSKGRLAEAEKLKTSSSGKTPIKWLQDVQVASEVTVIALDRHKFEMVLMASNGGRKVPATPLNFLLAAGGTLPYFDVDDVTAADVSEDNNIWAFYAPIKRNDVEVNGVLTPAFYEEMYRFYVLNAAYVYQITIILVRTPDQPPETWDEILSIFQSLRIVDLPRAN
jgi:hypothetical protein